MFLSFWLNVLLPVNCAKGTVLLRALTPGQSTRLRDAAPPQGALGSSLRLYAPKGQVTFFSGKLGRKSGIDFGKEKKCVNLFG